MSYFASHEASQGLAGIGCGQDCRCPDCRRVSPGGLAGVGCGGDCRCSACRTTALGETYRLVDDDEDDDDEGGGPRSERPSRPPAEPAPTVPAATRRAVRRASRPGRMRTGVAGFHGFGEGAGPRVVLVPGIMGSRLVERTTGLPVWGDPRMLAAVVSLPTLIAWRLALGSGNGINHGGRLLPRGLTNLPRIDPYTAIVGDLTRAFGAANVLPFSYDWRLSNEHSAALLQAAIRARWPDAGTGGARRVHLIAHSMGGLVSRWLVERLGGTSLVQTVTTVGTPHFGAPEALTMLAATSFGFVPGSTLASLIPGLGIVMREIAQLARGYGSVAQLLPGFDYFLPRGASSPESITATFARIRTSPLWTPIFGGSILRGPATRSIRNLNRGLTGALPGLNATLAAAGTRYFHIATTNLDTVVQARELAGPAITPVRSRCGDGTVPGTSAVLPAGSHITPLFRTSTLAHGDLFNDPAIRALCLSIVRGGTPAATPGPECAGPAPRTGLEGSLSCAGCAAAELQRAGLAEADALAAPW